MSISYPFLTVMCYSYIFGGVASLVSCVKILLGFCKNLCWVWKVFVTRFKRKTQNWVFIVWLFGDSYLSCETRKLFGHRFTVCVCVWRWETQKCFPFKWDLVIAPDPLRVCHLQWRKFTSFLETSCLWRPTQSQERAIHTDMGNLWFQISGAT
jgi:hypothetical protein